MEMHQIRYALAVADSLNFTRAAEKCHVTQPALSRAVQMLEEAFKENKWPSTSIKAALSSRTGLSITTIQTWFQNRRSRNKDVPIKPAVMFLPAPPPRAPLDAALPPRIRQPTSVAAISPASPAAPQPCLKLRESLCADAKGREAEVAYECRMLGRIFRMMAVRAGVHMHCMPAPCHSKCILR